MQCIYSIHLQSYKYGQFLAARKMQSENETIYDTPCLLISRHIFTWSQVLVLAEKVGAWYTLFAYTQFKIHSRWNLVQKTGFQLPTIYAHDEQVMKTLCLCLETIVSILTCVRKIEWMYALNKLHCQFKVMHTHFSAMQAGNSKKVTWLLRCKH